MTDNSPASLTSSLLARKGDAASSAEDALPVADDPLHSADDPLLSADDPLHSAEDPLQASGDAFQHRGRFDEETSVAGTPVEEDPNNFLDEGPETITPAASTRRRNWDEEVAKEDRGRSRGRRAPLLVLAVLLVVALAGAAWFAANLFLGGETEPRVAAGKSLIPVGATDGPTVATRSPPAPPAGTDAPAGMSSAPGAVDPVTNDPQDAPRLASPPDANPNGGAGDAAAKSSVTAPAPAAAEPPPAPPPPVSQLAPPPSPPADPPRQVAKEPPPPPVRANPAPSSAQPVAPPRPAPPAARKAVARPSGSYSIQLSSVRNRTAARKEMGRLATRFRDILADTPLRVRAANLGKKGTVYRVQSEAILSSRAAKNLCKAMKSKRQGCLVVAK